MTVAFEDAAVPAKWNRSPSEAFRMRWTQSALLRWAVPATFDPHSSGGLAAHALRVQKQRFGHVASVAKPEQGGGGGGKGGRGGVMPAVAGDGTTEGGAVLS